MNQDVDNAIGGYAEPVKADTQSDEIKQRNEAFKRHQIPGLQGLSRGSYDLGWKDGQAARTQTPPQNDTHSERELFEKFRIVILHELDKNPEIFKPYNDGGIRQNEALLRLLKAARTQTPPASTVAGEGEKALRQLVWLKEYKDSHGKDAYYEAEMPEAWSYAKTVLKEMV